MREWLSSRGAAASRAASRPAPGEAPRDPEAAAKRAAEREARVAGGVEDLQRWLRDAVRGGLGAGRLRTWDEWDAFAARLVDAQAPGAASRLRSLGGVAAGRPDGWPERLLSGLGLLHLLCEAHVRADGPLRDDVRALLGWNVGREEVLAGAHVADRWAVLARTVIEQERLRVQRTWLWGLSSGRPALLLDFAPPGGVLAPRPAPGMAMTGVARVSPGRGAAAGARGRRASESLARARCLRGPGGAAGRAAGRSRRRSRRIPGSRNGRWCCPPPSPTVVTAVRGALGRRTARCRSAASRTPAGGCWRVSGGRPVSLFGLWNGDALLPLAAGDGVRTVPL